MNEDDDEVNIYTRRKPSQIYLELISERCNDKWQGTVSLFNPFFRRNDAMSRHSINISLNLSSNKLGSTHSHQTSKHIPTNQVDSNDITQWNCTFKERLPDVSSPSLIDLFDIKQALPDSDRQELFLLVQSKRKEQIQLQEPIMHWKEPLHFKGMLEIMWKDAFKDLVTVTLSSSLESI